MRRTAEDYWMGHRPSEDGPPAYDLLAPDPEQGEPLIPDDVYEHPQYFTGFAQYAPALMSVLRSVRGKPDAEVTVYRAQGGAGLNHGDWVTLTREYAMMDWESEKADRTGERHVYSYRVKAKDVRFAMDDLMEWGYWGPSIAGGQKIALGPERVEESPGRWGWSRGPWLESGLPGIWFAAMLPNEGPIQRVDNRGPSLGAFRGKDPDWYIGHIYWDKDTGEVTDIWVKPEERGHGLATALWNKARSLDPKVRHSETQTDDGRAWSQHVGGAKGDLPEGITFQIGGPGELPDAYPYRPASGGEREIRALVDGRVIGQIRWLTHVNPVANVQPGHIAFAGVMGDYQRRGIASEMLRRAREDDPTVHHAPNTLTDDGRAWSEHVALPSWRDRGEHPVADVYIAPDTGRARRNSFEVFLHGQPAARRGSLAEAKAFIEDQYGPQTWVKVQGDRNPHHDPVHGDTVMFNDAPYYLVIEHLDTSRNALRLYRGEGSHDRPSYYVGPDASMAGGWWTTDLASAERYARSTENGQVYVIDVDESEAERRGLPQYRFISDPKVRERRRLLTTSLRVCGNLTLKDQSGSNILPEEVTTRGKAYIDALAHHYGVPAPDVQATIAISAKAADYRRTPTGSLITFYCGFPKESAFEEILAHEFTHHLLWERGIYQGGDPDAGHAPPFGQTLAEVLSNGIHLKTPAKTALSQGGVDQTWYHGCSQRRANEVAEHGFVDYRPVVSAYGEGLYLTSNPATGNNYGDMVTRQQGRQGAMLTMSATPKKVFESSAPALQQALSDLAGTSKIRKDAEISDLLKAHGYDALLVHFQKEDWLVLFDPADAHYVGHVDSVPRREFQVAAAADVQIEVKQSGPLQLGDWTVVARVGGEIVGRLSGGKYNAVEKVFVLPEYRRQGIATKMFKALLEHEPGMRMPDEFSDSGAAWFTKVNPDGREYYSTWGSDPNWSAWMKNASASYGPDLIARGLNLDIETPALAEKIRDGKVTAQDFINALNRDRPGHVGEWWGIMGVFGDIEDFEAYAYKSLDPDINVKGSLDYYAETKFWPGAECDVVLVAKRPVVNGKPWDPDDNPLEMGGLMGNSYLPSEQALEMVEIRYNGGWGWKSLDARGIRTHASEGVEWEHARTEGSAGTGPASDPGRSRRLRRADGRRGDPGRHLQRRRAVLERRREASRRLADLNPPHLDGPAARRWRTYSVQVHQQVSAAVHDLEEGQIKPDLKVRALRGFYTIPFGGSVTVSGDRVILWRHRERWIVVALVFDHDYSRAEEEIAGWVAARKRQHRLGSADPGWTINGKPYQEGVWIEVEPDVWYRGADHTKREIPSRLVVSKQPDGKWAWAAQVLTYIGAPHEDSGWQKPGRPHGVAKTLEDAKARAEKSLTKDHEFYQRYDDRQRANLERTKMGASGGRYWHGSPSGDLRGGAYGLHVGSREAARQALEARIGRRADGKDWDGTQEYGKTLLMGKANIPHSNHYPYVTGYSVSAPAEDHYPTGEAGYGDGSVKVPMTAKPDLFEVEILCHMNNTPDTPYSDSKANGYMKAAITRGTAKNGYYYTNEGEDGGSISAVVPGADSVRRTGRRTAVLAATEADDEHWRPQTVMYGLTQDHLDPRVFDGTHMKPTTRAYGLKTLNDFWGPKYGDWSKWAILYLAGSGASYWWAGDTDLDFLIGVDLEALRQARPANKGVSDQDIIDHLNHELISDLRPITAPYQPVASMNPMDVTYFVNPGSYDIRDIHPYAAYDVSNDRWVVEPPVVDEETEAHLIPDEVWRMCEASAREAEGVLSLPEPDRTAAGSLFFDWIHQGRQTAYSAHGQGWLDPGNVIYRYLEQHPRHLLRALYLCKHPEAADQHDIDDGAATHLVTASQPWHDTTMTEADLRALTMPGHGPEDLSGPVVDRYAEQFRRGEPVEPIQIEDSALGLYMTDGHHRLAGGVKAGVTEFPVRIYDDSPEGQSAARRALIAQGYKVAMPIDPDRQGKCYPLAYEYLMDQPDDNATLVHGTVTTGIGHAWVESGDKVYDPVLDDFFDHHYYYTHANAKPERVYTIDQAQEMAKDHYGPWHEGKVASSLSLENIISVAEEVMERGHQGGQVFDIPTPRLSDFPDGVWGAEYKAAVKPATDFVNGVLADEGHPGNIRIYQTSYDMEGIIAATDGMNSIQIARNKVNALTLLHECAHIILRTPEGEGHSKKFVETVARLYSKYISPAAGEKFIQVVTSVEPDTKTSSAIDPRVIEAENEFLARDHIPGATQWDAHDMCFDESRKFEALLQSKGVECELVCGYKQDEFMGQKVITQGHVGVRVGDRVWDWTARQFEPTAAVPKVMSYEKWLKEWPDLMPVKKAELTL